jgi:hypothetical protein
MTVVKPTALLVAASCGFWGGRIFPSVFVVVALGLTAHALVALLCIASLPARLLMTGGHRCSCATSERRCGDCVNRSDPSIR